VIYEKRKCERKNMKGQNMKAREKKKNFSRKMEGLLNAELRKRPTGTVGEKEWL
jgi:hypothetical protein